ncbi:MAG: polysaccharide deacetylase family protein [Candidatus Nomurabacteria bacterium]|nr:MAG: polysaccharide deacetylase family protein [Candidatus Nomurabacteria bacterium]
MSKAIALYLHVHQPYRVRPYSVFDIGERHDYFDIKDDSKLNNEKIFHKVADKSYRPMTALLRTLLDRHPDFKCSISITGDFIEQAEAWAPDVLDAFNELVATGRVEIVAETYYHSLAFFYNKQEFVSQVEQHRQKIKEVFGVVPTAFRNTELAYNDEVAEWADEAGYEVVLAEGWDPVLEWRSPNYVYRPAGTENISLLLKNYQLSDDLAFRFGDQSWNEWPLSVDKYASWVASNSEGPLVNLFMDFETFGEHQWADTGIFTFFEAFVAKWLSESGNSFQTVTGAARELEPAGELSMPQTVTWADSERDLSAWTGNDLQKESLKYAYALQNDVLRSNDVELIRDWRLLQSSDHFYYMATKWQHDGDVHKYFSPYDSPYDAFLSYMNAIRDVRLRLMLHHSLGGLNTPKPSEENVAI